MFDKIGVVFGRKIPKNYGVLAKKKGPNGTNHGLFRLVKTFKTVKVSHEKVMRKS